ncbi:MAG: hypothetical protein WBC88_09625, partial [Candidatus Zixiibacteriota bacterium]
MFSHRAVSERLLDRIDYSSWIAESFKASPDSRRIAYTAKVEGMCTVVVDGEEGEEYHGIG